VKKRLYDRPAYETCLLGRCHKPAAGRTEPSEGYRLVEDLYILKMELHESVLL
jgi:hypothetical protein